MKPHLFFATLAAGGGHVATARALAQAVERHYPGRFTPIVSDYMSDLGFHAEDERHKALWRWMLAHPWSARWGQRLMDRLPTLTNRLHRRTLDAVAKAAAAHLGALRPALVVANHGWLAVALTRAQRRYGLRARVLTFATEPLDASALWAEREAERFVVPSSGALADLVRFGVPEARIDLIGYPVQDAFLHPPAQAQARRALGLGDRLTCLVSLGGEGVGREAQRVVETLATHPTAPQVVVVTGRNAALRERLEARGGVHVFGFVDTMAELVAAADVVVGKAGPASVMEALAVGRPLLLTAYAGLNEQKLVRFVKARGFGDFVPTPEALGRSLARYAQPAVRERVFTESRRLGFDAMTRHLAHYLAAAATQGFPTRPVRERGLA
ncbi:glycosyltransferase [Truepera radiovictrix]|uniref:Glycosyltransferase 28 domain protein n=1 Tax=Truepera radiovictrix (strain DSM 17093 / CIP 108686 / LMG 22925 / RQ-24) TaxID=649638 RepID=D7CXS7_TRURR|nr:glycosyltransferase [Truepera radiovictrix]ADI14679.1 Glycosyltransferase 28 domain protein [Truepera radiovictrix DSM 17093]WMT56771.1 glycosyltransferase [Truepera radiovictrix]